MTPKSPQALADGWTEQFDRSMWWMADIPGLRERKLAERLVFALAFMDLAWVHERMRAAWRIRAEAIVAEIGWPKERWLQPRVAAMARYWNDVHDYVDGRRTDCPVEPTL